MTQWHNKTLMQPAVPSAGQGPASVTSRLPHSWVLCLARLQFRKLLLHWIAQRIVDVLGAAPHTRMELTGPCDAKGLMLVRSTCLAHLQNSRAWCGYPVSFDAHAPPDTRTANRVRG